MMTVRSAAERGWTELSWLDSRHTFSFGSYHDPRHVHFRALRVINDDRIGAGGGFGTHPHHDMEIITWVVDGALEHRDSMGNGEQLRAGELQVMTAGTGITHSEFNASQSDPLRLVQIWVMPERRGLKPRYAQRPFALAERPGELIALATPDGRDGSLPIHQDVTLYGAHLGPEHRVELLLAEGRHAWVQVVRGAVRVQDTPLVEGDGAALTDERLVTLQGAVGSDPAEVLVFDLG